MTTVEVGALVASDDGGSPFVLERGFAGWFDGPATRSTTVVRQGAHGTFPERAWRTGRLVSVPVAGRFATADEVEDARDLLAAVLADGEFAELRVTSDAGRTLTADVRIDGTPLIDVRPWSGVVRGMIQFYAPDPLRYGSPVSASTGFPVLAGGLEYDLYTDGAGTDLGYLDYGVASDTGRMVLTNTGTAPAPVLWQVDGAVAAQGFEIAQVDGPGRLRFAGPNSATSTLVLDGATGNVLVDGDSDRGGLLTWRDWPVIPAATRVAGVLVPGSIEVAFIPLGASSSARLTAVVRPGSW